MLAPPAWRRSTGSPRRWCRAAGGVARVRPAGCRAGPPACASCPALRRCAPGCRCAALSAAPPPRGATAPLGLAVSVRPSAIGRSRGRGITISSPLDRGPAIAARAASTSRIRIVRTFRPDARSTSRTARLRLTIRPCTPTIRVEGRVTLMIQSLRLETTMCVCTGSRTCFSSTNTQWLWWNVLYHIDVDVDVDLGVLTATGATTASGGIGAQPTYPPPVRQTTHAGAQTVPGTHTQPCGSSEDPSAVVVRRPAQRLIRDPRPAVRVRVDPVPCRVRPPAGRHARRHPDVAVCRHGHPPAVMPEPLDEEPHADRRRHHRLDHHRGRGDDHGSRLDDHGCRGGRHDHRRRPGPVPPAPHTYSGAGRPQRAPPARPSARAGRP